MKEKEEDINDLVAHALFDDVVELSKQKFSSNVVEKVPSLLVFLALKLYLLVLTT